MLLMSQITKGAGPRIEISLSLSERWRCHGSIFTKPRGIPSEGSHDKEKSGRTTQSLQQFQGRLGSVSRKAKASDLDLRDKEQMWALQEQVLGTPVTGWAGSTTDYLSMNSECKLSFSLFLFPLEKVDMSNGCPE